MFSLIQPKKRLDVHIAHVLASSLFLMGMVQALVLNVSAVLHFATIEDKMSAEDVSRSLAALESERQALLDMTREFGAWDDTRDFVLNGTPEYNAEAFGSVWLSQAGMEAVAVCDLKGTALFTWTSSSALKPALASVLTFLSDHPSHTAYSGFFTGDDRPLFAAAWPVTSNDFIAPPVGWVVMARELGGVMLQRLSVRSGLETELLRAESGLPQGRLLRGSDILARDEKGLRILYLPLKGTGDRLVATLSLRRPRRFDSILRIFSIEIIALSVLFALVSSLLTHGLLRSIVVRPLERMCGHLKTWDREGSAGDELAMGLSLGRKDEVGSLADAIDSILAGLESRRVELCKANQELERLALVDPLTGLANRRSLEEHLRKEMRRLSRIERRGSIPYTTVVLLCDIDHFKLYNDSYGHQAGDECLVAVATAIAGEAHRPGDLACRYGGEEFLVTLPGTDAEGGKTVAERIMKAVQSLALPHRSSPTAPYVTLSIGMGVKEFNASDDDFQATIRAADEALYRAKDGGRNRVVSG